MELRNRIEEGKGIFQANLNNITSIKSIAFLGKDYGQSLREHRHDSTMQPPVPEPDADKELERNILMVMRQGKSLQSF